MAEELSMPFKRFDMSAYSDSYAHLGLIGFEKTWKSSVPGELTIFVKENPYCILLFDEIEKAHLNTINLFLQILDAGRLTDKYTEETVSFRNTVIVFTTNAGAFSRAALFCAIYTKKKKKRQNYVYYTNRHPREKML
ncbi:MAG: AAA family ATPase [Oscillospiraceae bacterium]|jgi:ATP-dependent Clp protease ATP-binding subunit ClpA|nr:AAA family ATPase [Oscillospiraceae bacterium]